jgi:hypothetical protein
MGNVSPNSTPNDYNSHSQQVKILGLLNIDSANYVLITVSVC